MGRNSKSATKIDNLTRSEQEGMEAAKDVKIDAPKTRYQTDQQVGQADDALMTKTDDTSFSKKKVKASGGELKQEVAAAVVTGRGAGSGHDVNAPSTYGLRTLRNAYSGDTGTISGSASDTPVATKDIQGRSRVDKKLSDPNKDINYLASEQIEVEYTNVPSLADDNGTVGYNGNPKNVAARVQKNSGATPAELLYDRSVDYIVTNNFLFAAGQTVKQKNVEYDDYPKMSDVVKDKDGEVVSGNVMLQTRGNYAPRYIQVKFKDDGQGAYVSSFQVIEDDLSCNNETAETVNRTGANEKRFMNLSELARQRIDAKCGSPTQEHFNPLGRSITEATATMGYLRDIEASDGATLFTAYKMANKAKAFYLSRTVKDGQDLVTPGIDALYGHLLNNPGSAKLKDEFAKLQDKDDKPSGAFRCTTGLVMGSAALLLGLFDSWNKYKTKADIVTQPRGLKLHLQTADNMINIFRCEKNFVAALNSVDTFSCIDRGYDPMSPICATDATRLIYPYSWAKALQFTRDSAGADRVYQSVVYKYNYAAGNGLNCYTITVGEPLLNGVAYFLEMHADEIFDTLRGKVGNEVTLNIPTVHYGMHFGLWDYLLCASVPYIVYERTNSMKDILDYETNFEYPFSDLVPIGKANPLNAVNYKALSPMEPLTPGQMMDSSAIRWKMPEMLVRMGADGVMLPFYFSENEYEASGTAGSPMLRHTREHAYTTPVIRSGIRLAALNSFWDMDAKSSQLCYDRMVRHPFALASNPKALEDITGVVYKYAQDSEGIPVVTGVSALKATGADYLSTPRQMGWFMPGIAGLFYSTYIETGVGKTPGIDGIKDATDLAASKFEIKPDYRMVMYKGIKGPATHATLDSASVSIDRGQSFTQRWFTCNTVTGAEEGFDVHYAIGDIVDGNKGVINGVGTKSKYNPFIFDSSDVTNNIYTSITLFSYHNDLWGMLQKMPFIISPFEWASAGCGCIDPFATAYVFGLAGFMAADYAEEDYNRVNQILNQGYGYTTDPFIAASPVFKDAVRFTEI